MGRFILCKNCLENLCIECLIDVQITITLLVKVINQVWRQKMKEDELLPYVGEKIRIYFKPYGSWVVEDVLGYDPDRETFFITQFGFIASDVDEIEEIK